MPRILKLMRRRWLVVVLTVVVVAVVLIGAGWATSSSGGGEGPAREGAEASAPARERAAGSPGSSGPSRPAGGDAPVGGDDRRELEDLDPAELGAPPPGVVDDDTGEVIEPQVVPRWDDESRQAVVAAAEKAMRAFARPDLAHEAWWAQLEPLLDATAALDYWWVDPANIPVRAVAGPGVLVDDASAYVARVQVPTDIGPYTLVLNREAGGAPWMVVRFEPPDTAG